MEPIFFSVSQVKLPWMNEFDDDKGVECNPGDISVISKGERLEMSLQCKSMIVKSLRKSNKRGQFLKFKAFCGTTLNQFSIRILLALSSFTSFLNYNNASENMKLCDTSHNAIHCDMVSVDMKI